jgi:hypothetical protein
MRGGLNSLNGERLSRLPSEGGNEAAEGAA